MISGLRFAIGLSLLEHMQRSIFIAIGMCVCNDVYVRLYVLCVIKKKYAYNISGSHGMPGR